MSEEPVPYTCTDKAMVLTLQARIAELERILRHFDQYSMHLWHYVKAIDGLPSQDEWANVRDMTWEMVDPYGPRNPNR